MRTNADELIAVADADDEWRRIGLIVGFPAHRLPSHLPGGLVERDDISLVVTVAVDDQKVSIERRRAAGAVLRLIPESGFPKKLALRRERGGAVGAEMHKDAVAFNDRGRRGVTVLGVSQVQTADQE